MPWKACQSLLKGTSIFFATGSAFLKVPADLPRHKEVAHGFWMHSGPPLQACDSWRVKSVDCKHVNDEDQPHISLIATALIGPYTQL